MSIGYAITLSPYRWLIIAGLVFAGTLLGTIFILAFEWSHSVARVWLYAGLVATVVCLVLFFLDWKRQAEQIIDQVSPPRSDDEAVGPAG